MIRKMNKRQCNNDNGETNRRRTKGWQTGEGQAKEKKKKNMRLKGQR